MTNLAQFALNRITCPDLGLEDFFKLTADLGLRKVELRNDLPGGRVSDDLAPGEVIDLCRRYGIRVITINALQKFNVAAIRSRLIDELRELIVVAQGIHCPALVLCPNNDRADSRTAGQMRSETVSALTAFAPVFSDGGVTGLVEPLGFPESSLDSLVNTVEMIEESGATNYRIVHDTFHHKLGPDSSATLPNDFDIRYTGLVHVSGVEAEIPPGQYTDAHRGLVGPKDKLNSREQVQELLQLGYSGDISFEAFAESVQHLPVDLLKQELASSLRFLRE